MSYFNNPTSVSEGRLQVVHGYYELGMLEDAWEELREIEKSFPATPAILLTKILLHVKAKQWEDALKLSGRLRHMEPNSGAGYIHGAYCLHELDRTVDALDLLESAPDALRDEAIYHYNKGCYQAAIGDRDSALTCLERSFVLDEGLVKIARKDPDLAELQDAL